ncbi:hypothetical protein [Bacillus pumilus]|uniref:hypothetical protein n=1 Tax=Bacillus pumilus TaxID=1408 RepID=UPI0028141897|nr:hypothetical protein [Bacillus pumilus]MDR0121186.1 hypothetical protein [Bacillus pumilus]
MKFFKVRDPYIALIKANTKENAMKIYKEEVADDDGSLSKNMTEVTETYAAIRYGRAYGEDNKIIPVEEVLKDLTSEEEMTLIIDGSLL